MKILYLHGYGSKFDPESSKIQTLATLGEVSGPDLDYGLGQDGVLNQVESYVGDDEFDLVIGTSMGGWLASHVGGMLCIPFAALNPAVSPSKTLKKYVGKTVNYVGHDCRIDEKAVQSYADIRTKGGCGVILCEEGDEVLDAKATVDYLDEFYGTELIPGGSHRFESLEQYLDRLKFLVVNAGAVWGNDSFD